MSFSPPQQQQQKTVLILLQYTAKRNRTTRELHTRLKSLLLLVLLE